MNNQQYEKYVFVRWTTDNWVTYTDTRAEHYEHSKDGDSDDFSFVLDATEDCSDDLQLAICYRTPKGEEFWDNNSEENYTISV